MATKKKPAVKAAKKPVPAKKAAPVKKAAPKPATNGKSVKQATPAKKAIKANNHKPVAKKASPAPAKKTVEKAAKPAPKAVKAAPAKNVAKAPAKDVKKPEPKKAVSKEIKEPLKEVKAASKTTSKPEPKAVESKAATPKTESRPAEAKATAPKAEAKAAAPKKETPAKPVKVVIPEMKTKSVKKYEPEFVKSVLDTPETTQTGPTMRYSDAELTEFRDLIQKKLDQAKKELAYLQGLITRKDEMGGDETENRYMTMEDGSMSMEREQLAQMASRQINYIDHLEKAMIRIENKTYGICRVTGKLIDKARLRAVPHATLSIEAKQMMNK